MLPEKIGRYELKSEIGRGGMAVVYLARDPNMDREVAIKVLPRQLLESEVFRKRFEREAKVIAAFEHPAIVPVYDYGEQSGQLYLVMRFMAGGSLADRILKQPLEFSEAAQIFSRLAPALDQVHARGIIHRDLKPGNILFDRYGNAYISDFGIAHIMEGNTNLTGDLLIGTPAYMSPEQVRGEKDIDARTDIYALGAILFEVLTGKLPYESTTPIGLALKQISEPVPRILDVRHDLPPETQEIINRAMAKNREERYSSGSELADVLQSVATRQTTPQTVAVTAVQPAKPSKPVQASAEQDFDKTVVGPSLNSEVLPERTPTASKKWVVIAGIGLLVLILVSAGIWLAGRMMNAGAQEARLTETAPARISVAAVTTPGTSGGTQPAPVDEITLQAPESSARAPGPAIFQDDFSDSDSGWEIFSDERGSVGYYRGNYRVFAELENIIAWGMAFREYRDVAIEVDATKVSGTDNNYIGVICRYLDESNYYLLGIQSSGYYSIEKHKAGESQLLASDYMGYSDAIHKGNTANHLEVQCIGDTLTLYVNGIKLLEAKDGDLQVGDVGLAAAAYDVGNTEILFDNFTARIPTRK